MDKSIRWINDEFIPVEKLFSHWFTAKIVLNKYCDELDKLNGIVVDISHSILSIFLEQPTIEEEITGLTADMFEVFPPEDKPLFVKIEDGAVYDYTPRLDDIFYDIATPEIKSMISIRIKQWEAKIVNLGGRTLKDEIRFRLGILK